jgi:hypothetical protein
MPIDEVSSDALAECLSDHDNDDYEAAYRFCIQAVIDDEGLDDSQINNWLEKLRAAPPAKVIQFAEKLRRDTAADPVEIVPEEPDPQPAVHTDDNTFSVVENYALDHPDCGMAEVAVYTTYCRHAHFPKKTSSISIKGIADRLNVNWRTIRKAVANLVAIGLLEPVKKTSSGAMIYKLPHRYRPRKKSRK